MAASFTGVEENNYSSLLSSELGEWCGIQMHWEDMGKRSWACVEIKWQIFISFFPNQNRHIPHLLTSLCDLV